MRRIVRGLAMLVMAGAVAAFADQAVDPRLKVFATQKRRQMERLAAQLHLAVPPEARAFFVAAELGDAGAVTNRFEKLWQHPRPSESGLLPGLENVLYVPIHETLGAYTTFGDWDGRMLEKFADGILGSIPAGSVYFGMTDPGRFVIATVRDVAGTPDIFVITPKFVFFTRRNFGITQDELADSSYTEYLRRVYGGQLWIPSVADLQAAFQEYVSSVEERRKNGQPFGPDEGIHVDAAGHVSLRGAGGVMAVYGSIAKMIFEHNKAQHEFYFEESFVMPWTYPYLEPHGLIMKLNPEPLAQLDPAVVARDRQFWDGLAKELLGDAGFLDNPAARRTFSKLRSAIGGLYSYRHMTAEAEYAFKQAISLCPAGAEANFRLAQVYVEQNRNDDAIAVLSALRKLDPLSGKIAEAIDQLQRMKENAAASPDTNRPASPGP